MIYLGVFAISLILTFFVRKLAIEKNLIDIPDHRSSHDTPTPTGGGTAIVIAFYIGLTYLFMSSSVESKIFFSLLSGLPMIIIAKLDDIYDISPKLRFIVQVITVVLALQIFGTFSHNPWYISILCIISLLWMINLYNFLDGIDGYAASEALFVSFGAYLFFPSPLLFLVFFAVLGFFPYNWQKASIFMGDVGSVFLGFVFGMLALYTSETVPDIVIWMILFALFWFDSTITLFRRAFMRENIFEAHRKHAFQRVTRIGFSHQKTVLFAMGINILALLVLLLVYKSELIYLFFMFYILLLSLLLVFIESKKGIDD
jgi:Fuc2NAc and GlcNAc transferase